jgi:hypothetical protein
MPPRGRRDAFTDALSLGAPVITAVLIVVYVTRHEFAVDFQQQYWVVGHRLLTGGSPYAWTHSQIASGVGAFPYPALSALLFIPLALIPKGVAAAFWVSVQMAAVIATLWVLSVRDRRCYLVAFLWWPVIIGWQTGNMTLVLTLLVALVWRYRDEPVASGVLTAVMISLKPFVWPVALWLLATRRYRAAAWAAGLGLALNLAAWSAVGFDRLSAFVRLDSQVTTALYHDGYGVIAIATRLGVGRSAGTVAMIVIAVGIAGLAVRLGRTRRDDLALLACVVLALVASPLLWTHYAALLMVPLAILRPRLSREWLLPLLLWVCPGGLQESAWQVAAFALIIAVISYLLLTRRPRAL